MTQQDLPDLEEMLLDPAVMYAYEHTFTQQEVREWLERQQQRYLRDGFGLWAVVYRRTGEMVGQAGLTMQDCQGAAVPEVGYLLKRRFWVRGYAREAALACRDYAFEVLGMGAGVFHHQNRQPSLHPSDGGDEPEAGQGV